MWRNPNRRGSECEKWDITLPENGCVLRKTEWQTYMIHSQFVMSAQVFRLMIRFDTKGHQCGCKTARYMYFGLHHRKISDPLLSSLISPCQSVKLLEQWPTRWECLRTSDLLVQKNFGQFDFFSVNGRRADLSNDPATGFVEPHSSYFSLGM